MSNEDLVFDYSKLLGRIKEKKGTQREYASCLGMSVASVNNKLRQRTRFTPDEIIASADALDISKNEIGSYFFTLKV